MQADSWLPNKTGPGACFILCAKMCCLYMKRWAGVSVQSWMHQKCSISHTDRCRTFSSVEPVLRIFKNELYKGIITEKKPVIQRFRWEYLEYPKETLCTWRKLFDSTCLCGDFFPLCLVSFGFRQCFLLSLSYDQTYWFTLANPALCGPLSWCRDNSPTEGRQ